MSIANVCNRETKEIASTFPAFERSMHRPCNRALLVHSIASTPGTYNPGSSTTIHFLSEKPVVYSMFFERNSFKTVLFVWFFNLIAQRFIKTYSNLFSDL